MKAFIYGLCVLACMILFGCGHPNLKATTVMLVSGRGSCSGTQVKAQSGKLYILSAAHCKAVAFGEKEQDIMAITEDGHMIVRKIVAIDSQADLLLLEGIPGVDAVPIAKAAKTGDAVVSYTHGHGLPTYEAKGKLTAEHTIKVGMPVESEEELERCKTFGEPIMTLMGFYCLKRQYVRGSTMKAMPGSSGGGVLNAKTGELVGVVSAGNDTDYNAQLVTLKAIRRFLAKR